MSVSAWAFAGFVYAGSFKTYPWLAWVPIDITVLLAVVSSVLVAATLRRNRNALAPQVAMVLVFFGVCALALLWTDFTDYARYKVVRMFTLTLWAAIGAAVLFRSNGAVLSFRNACIALGLLSVLDAVALRSTTDHYAQMQLLSADSISTGRLGALCASFLWVGVLQTRRPDAKAVQLALLAMFVVLVQAAGARGPAIGLLLALFIISIRLVNVRSGAFFRLVFAGLVLTFALQLGLSLAPTQAASRLTEFYAGQTDWLMTDRPTFFVEAATRIVTSPLGIGWGGFEQLYLGFAATGVWPPVRSYPHNLFLEVTLEGGWIAGLLLISLSVIALRRLWRSPNLDIAAIPLAALLITTVGVMASGDFNDNRDYFAYLGMALAVSQANPRMRRNTPASVSPGPMPRETSAK